MHKIIATITQYFIDSCWADRQTVAYRETVLKGNINSMVIDYCEIITLSGNKIQSKTY